MECNSMGCMYRIASPSLCLVECVKVCLGEVCCFACVVSCPLAFPNCVSKRVLHFAVCCMNLPCVSERNYNSMNVRKRA